MALGANSYGTVIEVAALCQVYLAGNVNFTFATLPTDTDVETFLNRCSGVLNLALSAGGFTIPVTQADAKLACDDWVITRAVAYVEASQPFVETETQKSKGVSILSTMQADAIKFVEANSAGFAVLGVAQTANDTNALIFTGQTAQADRSDPSDTSLEQPKFTRGQFDS